MPELDERVSRLCTTVLTEKGITVVLGKKVKSVGSREIELSDGSKIHSETAIWTAGIRPNSLISNLNDTIVQKKNGRIVVDKQPRLPRFREVYALGDCAHVSTMEGGAVPATASAADLSAARYIWSERIFPSHSWILSDSCQLICNIK